MATPLSHQAKFVVAPEVVVSHSPDRSFIGPGTIRLENGDILMAAPWGPRRQAVSIRAAAWRPSSSMLISRIRNFWILPVTVVGKASTNFQ
jgi:hypothetical protein